MMRLGKYVLLSVLLLALVACSTTHEGNLDAFVQKYPQSKEEIAKLDPDVKSRMVVPLKYPFTVSKIEVSATTNVPDKKPDTLDLTVFPKDIPAMVLITIKDAKGIAHSGDTGIEDLKLNHGVTAKYKDNKDNKWMMWYDDQKKLIYGIIAGRAITKDQLIQIANQIIGE